MEKTYTAADLRELLAEIEKSRNSYVCIGQDEDDHDVYETVVAVSDIRSCFARLSPPVQGMEWKDESNKHRNGATDLTLHVGDLVLGRVVLEQTDVDEIHIAGYTSFGTQKFFAEDEDEKAQRWVEQQVTTELRSLHLADTVGGRIEKAVREGMIIRRNGKGLDYANGAFCVWSEADLTITRPHYIYSGDNFDKATSVLLGEKE